MAKYKAKRDVWVSHECRLVKAGDEFEATFPEHMKLGTTLELVAEPAPEDQKAEKKADKSKARDLV